MHINFYITWLWQAIDGFRAKIFTRALLGVLHVCCALLFVWCSKHLVDIATGAQGSIAAGVVVLVCCVVLQIAISTIASRIEVRAEIEMRNKLRFKLFRHVMTSRWMGRDGIHTGDLLNRMDTDVYVISDTVCRVLPSVLTTCVQFAAAVVFLSMLDWRLAVVLICIMPFALLVSRIYMKRIRRYTKDIRDMDGRLTMYMQEYMQNRTLVSTMEYTSHATEDFESMQSSLRGMIMKRTNFSLFSRKIVQLGFSSGYIIALLWGVMGLKEGTITFGMITAFLQLVSQVQRPIVDLSRLLPSFIHVTTSLDRLSDIVTMPQELLGNSERLVGDVGIRFSNVEFAYSDDGNVIDNLNCDIRPMSINAVVGPTGVGKSTLVRLILALITPQRGRIELYNHHQSIEVSAATRCNIAYVPQGNSLLSGTIRSNLLLANPDATEEQMVAALHASVADFVFDLPNQLDTLCGESGGGFSEGQAQRIAIARGLLRNGTILLLDEPTAALDGGTERLLLERMREYAVNKTIIIVTHSEWLAAECDNVIAL